MKLVVSRTGWEIVSNNDPHSQGNPQTFQGCQQTYKNSLDFSDADSHVRGIRYGFKPLIKRKERGGGGWDKSSP